ncbi:MAG TPA: bifunctional 4-hydroxy-2-oxoglutarate aldolase/2-dehydro-3-deoxy-phosphogluconate aldolase [Gemmatimonadaceae bacterium]|nr:bifunctional 4-hydroxy-2-oxoglutarate aldolase/2-dehydro-3-deoxy-phosphogluconate aldolase [Gemmatimonadaceae bacterium]
MKALLDVGVIPVVRCDASDVAGRVTEVLIDAGLPIAEITFTVPDAVDVIAKLARRRGVIGAGTVTNADQARAAIRAGAEFIVSPGFVPEVIEVAKSAGVTMIAGALTPTEILDARRAGADLIKVFPVQSLGGPSYLRALRGPFPDIPLVPTGGVDLGNVAEFIRAGAAAVGVGSELISRQALAAGNYPAIAERAALFVAAVAKARRAEVQCS